MKGVVGIRVVALELMFRGFLILFNVKVFQTPMKIGYMIFLSIKLNLCKTKADLRIAQDLNYGHFYDHGLQLELRQTRTAD
jgi:hypothetical protein